MLLKTYENGGDAEHTQPPDNSPYIRSEGLTQRRRDYILSCQPPSPKYAKRFRNALIRLRGFRFWNKMLEEIRVFGTGSVLFDAEDNYKVNIKEIMDEKVLMINNQVEAPPKVEKVTVLNPESQFYSIWSMIILGGLLYTFTLMPWIIAFEDVEIGNGWFIVETLVDLIFFTDICITLNTSYYNKAGDLVSSRWKIFFHYLTGMMVIDIISVFPFYLVFNSNHTSQQAVIRVIRLSRAIRILRASKINKIIKILGETDTFSFLNTHQGITRLVGGLFFVLLLAHFTACIWLFSAKIDNFGPDTWVTRNNRQDASNSVLYLCSLYFSCTVLTTVGFGDIKPFTDVEKVISIMWMVCGIGCYSFVVGNLSSVLSSLDQKKAFINEKLKLIHSFAEETMLSEDITIKIGKKVKKAFDKTSLNDDEKISIVKKLKKDLRYELATKIYDEAIQSIDFFKSKDKTFVADIVPMLNFLAVKKKKLVYDKHKYADEMYFIKTGRICFIYGKQKMIFKSMIPGSYFGEIELIENTPREFAVASQEDAELLTMSKNVFDYMMSQYPSVAIILKKVAIERKKRNIKCKKELVDVLEKVEVRKETTFGQLAGKEKIRKGTNVDKSLNDKIYVGEDVQIIVGEIYERLDYYDSRITGCARLYKNMKGNGRIPRKTLPPLVKSNRMDYQINHK